jgi:hypothetical protein
MSGIFLMGEAERAAIRTAVEIARDKPIPWEVLRQFIPDNQHTDTVSLEDRPRTPPRDPEQVLLPMGYRLAVSFEHQPAGLFAHLSLSTSAPGKLPHPLAFAMVVKAAGFEHGAQGRVWIEEYLIDGKPGGRAINALFLVETAIHQ